MHNKSNCTAKQRPVIDQKHFESWYLITLDRYNSDCVDCGLFRCGTRHRWKWCLSG